MNVEKPVILIVDDTPSNIEILSEILGDEQEILFATNGSDALEIAIHEMPGLILLDIIMPDMDGYEVCSRLKSDPRTRSIPVIFITSMTQEEDEAKGLEIGAIDYITKPINPPIVRARVRNHLELKQYRDLLEHQSSIDGLTGIANRRRFDEFLDQEWRRAIRNKTSLSLIMMDIDYFKLFNDNYGHLVGDDCLKQVAQTLTEAIYRSSDLVARFGGEEFMCVLPDTDIVGAVNIAKRFRESVETLDIRHDYSPTTDHITISLGVATTSPSRQLPPTSLIDDADKQLYKAKRTGRNRVVYAGKNPDEE